MKRWLLLFIGMMMPLGILPRVAAQQVSGMEGAEYMSDAFIALGVALTQNAHVSESTLLSSTVLEVTGLTRMKPEAFLKAVTTHFEKRGFTASPLPPALRELGMRAVAAGDGDYFGVALISDKPIKEDLYLIKLYSPRPPGAKPFRPRMRDRHPEIALLASDPLLEREQRSGAGSSVLLIFETRASAGIGVENTAGMLASFNWERRSPLIRANPEDPDDLVVMNLSKGSATATIVGSKPSEDDDPDLSTIMVTFTFPD